MQSKSSYKNIIFFSGVLLFLTLLLSAFAWAKIPEGTPVPLH